jgi:hypothetical protein
MKSQLGWRYMVTHYAKRPPHVWLFDCLTPPPSNDGFFFCHWLSGTDEDIHNALRDTGLDNFVFTACYKSQMHIYANFLSDAPALPTSASMNA